MNTKHANHFPLTDPVEYKPKSFISSAEILQKIWPMLTPDRQKKIENVVSKRCFSIPVVLESIYDRGNISAVMRTAEGLGFTNFHVIETWRSLNNHSVSPKGLINGSKPKNGKPLLRPLNISKITK